MAQDTSLRGGKCRPEKVAPSAPLLPAPMTSDDLDLALVYDCPSQMKGLLQTAKAFCYMIDLIS